MKSGADRETGADISGLNYLRQRFNDAINTTRGSLVGNRKYGSDFHMLVDRNVDSSFKIDLFIKLAELVSNKENGLDDIKIKTMMLERVASNHWQISITAVLLDNKREIVMDGIVFNVGN